MSGQPEEWERFAMFTTISLLVIFVAQGIGLVIGAWFSVVVSIFYLLIAFQANPSSVIHLFEQNHELLHSTDNSSIH